MSQCTYSSARQGLIEDGMTYAEEDELLAEILDEIYETFIISAVLVLDRECCHEFVGIPDAGDGLGHVRHFSKLGGAAFAEIKNDICRREEYRLPGRYTE